MRRAMRGHGTPFLNSLAIAAALAPTVVMDSTVATKLLGTTDAELQAAVEFEAQQLLL